MNLPAPLESPDLLMASAREVIVAMCRILELLNAGAGNLAAYLAAHVLLCLLPAFFIADAMAALIPEPSICVVSQTRILTRSRMLGTRTLPTLALMRRG